MEIDFNSTYFCMLMFNLWIISSVFVSSEFQFKFMLISLLWFLTAFLCLFLDFALSIRRIRVLKQSTHNLDNENLLLTKEIKKQLEELKSKIKSENERR